LIKNECALNSIFVNDPGVITMLQLVPQLYHQTIKSSSMLFLL